MMTETHNIETLRIRNWKNFLQKKIKISEPKTFVHFKTDFMKKILFKPYHFLIAMFCVVFLFSCQKDMKEPGGPNGGSNIKNTSVPKELKDFVLVNLVSDMPNAAANLDANLKNGWGLAISSTGQIRVNAEAVGVSGVY